MPLLPCICLGTQGPRGGSQGAGQRNRPEAGPFPGLLRRKWAELPSSRLWMRGQLQPSVGQGRRELSPLPPSDRQPMPARAAVPRWECRPPKKRGCSPRGLARGPFQVNKPPTPILLWHGAGQAPPGAHSLTCLSLCPLPSPGSLPTSFPTYFLVGFSGAFLGNPLYCKMNKRLQNNRRPQRRVWACNPSFSPQPPTPPWG